MENRGGHIEGQGEGHVEVVDQEQASNQEIRRIVQESMKDILPGLLQEAIGSSAPGRRTPGKLSSESETPLALKRIRGRPQAGVVGIVYSSNDSYGSQLGCIQCS